MTNPDDRVTIISVYIEITMTGTLREIKQKIENLAE